jgi:DNA helicase-2/ATP-dependent DNA helicase PcrA
MTGEPRKDWLVVKTLLRNSGDQAFADMAGELDYLVAFGKGRRIEEGLSASWMEHGKYVNARAVLDLALLQDQLLGGTREEGGIYVMNTHKAKGKQFDGVVLYRQQHHSPFVWRGETIPFKGSRTLLHMAITRARKHVLILSEAFPQCALLRSHGL